MLHRYNYGRVSMIHAFPRYEDVKEMADNAGDWRQAVLVFNYGFYRRLPVDHDEVLAQLFSSPSLAVLQGDRKLYVGHVRRFEALPRYISPGLSGPSSLRDAIFGQRYPVDLEVLNTRIAVLAGLRREASSTASRQRERLLELKGPAVWAMSESQFEDNGLFALKLGFKAIGRLLDDNRTVILDR